MNEQGKLKDVYEATQTLLVYNAGYAEGVKDVIKKTCETTLVMVGAATVVRVILALMKKRLNNNSTTEEVDPT